MEGMEGVDMRMKWMVLSVILLALSCASAWAQEVTGSIAGTVTDPQGAVVPNATVTLTNTDRNAVMRTVKSGANGDYSAPLLPIGHYQVDVDASGFQKFTATGIVLNINDKLTVNAKMAVSGASQTVNVQEQANQVELQSAQAAGLITGTQVRELALNAYAHGFAPTYWVAGGLYLAATILLLFLPNNQIPKHQGR